jgi:hypothetical protein
MSAFAGDSDALKNSVLLKRRASQAAEKLLVLKGLTSVTP